MSSSTQISRKVIKKVLSVEQSEGVGARVRRSIGRPELRNLDPFLMLDEFKANKADGGGFPSHPHRGIQTFTYMLEGSFMHEDFIGNKGILEAGSVQVMSAGKGIVHAEMPHSQFNRGMQLWVNMAAKDKLSSPTYQEIRADKFPIAYPYGKEKGGVSVKVISGESFGVSSPVHTLTPVYYLDFNIEANQSESMFQHLPEGWTSFVYTLEGKIKFGDSDQVHEAHNTLVLSSEASQNGVVIQPTGDGARFVLISGKPLHEPIVQHGPVVMNTQKQIQEFFEDYSYGRNGFENAPGWRASIDSGKFD